MSEVKHTPGPWSFDGPRHSIIVWGPTPELRVCFMTSDGPATANARLIAAAPDLLAACGSAFDFLGGVDGASAIRDQLLAALSKAEPRP